MVDGPVVEGDAVLVDAALVAAGGYFDEGWLVEE